jgi:hypothetical protein
MNSMFRRLMALVPTILGICVCLVIPLCAHAADPQGYEAVADNGRLTLFVNHSTTEIAVRDNLTGEIWHSNPPGAKVEKYQLLVTYFDPEDKRKRLDSNKDAVAYSQFDIEPIPNGVSISYTLGQEWKDDDFIPLAISYDRMQSEIMAKLEPKDQEFVLKQYELLQYQRLENPDTSGTLGPEKMWGKYDLVALDRDLKSTEKNTLNLLMIDRLVDQREDVEARADVTEDMMLSLVDNPTYILKARVLPWDKTTLVQTLRRIDYTPEDVGVDSEQYSLPAPVPNNEVFDITIEYTLDDNALIVAIPMDKVRYPKDVEAQLAYVKGAASAYQGQVGRGNIYQYFEPIGGNVVTFPLYSLSVLPFFGAAPKNTEGYLFVPDGSGAILDISRLNDRAYRKPVYGKDYPIYFSITEQGEEVVPTPDPYAVVMPVFGFKKGSNAFVSVVESGAEFAYVCGQISGSVNSYSYVYSDFVLMPYGLVRLATTERSERGGDKSINVYAERLPNEDIRLRYVFLDTDSADYAGMARYYQEYLVENGVLKKADSNGKVPFLLEIVGSIRKQVPVLGIPVYTTVALTTFDEAKQMVDRLSVAGVTDIVVQFSGWLNDGLDHEFPNRVAVNGAVGGAQKLRELASYLKERGVEFFPSVYFQIISTTAGNLNWRREAAKDPSGKWVVNVLSPNRLATVVSSFLKNYTKLGIDGISLNDLGSELVSDYDPGRIVDRAEALGIVKEQLRRVRDDYDLDIMVSYPNIYALPYAKYAVEVPLEATQYTSVTDSVPFLQMVIRGYSIYAGSALNVSDNMRKEVLKSIEVGAYPYFQLFYRDPSIVKGSDYAFLYSCNFEDWFDDAVAVYDELHPVLSKVADQRIVDHARLAADVYQTTFENGVSVVVNYGSDQVEVNGIQVDGLSYRVIEGGRNGAN